MRNLWWVGIILAVAFGTPGSSKDLTKQEDSIRKRDRQGNGIFVDAPKVYDDSLLQQMLQAAQARLAALQVIDTAGVVKGFGALTGGTLNSSGFGLSIQGAPMPQVVTANKGATGSTATTSGNPVVTTAVIGFTGATGMTGPEGNIPLGATYTGSNTTASTKTDQTVTTLGQATTDRTVTVPQFSVPTATAPTSTAALPSGFGVSASDLLNEQMQLTYEIANLRLLLEGALNDRVIDTDQFHAVKPRTTIGFPVTLRPDKRYKNAVAVVEVEVETTADSSEYYERTAPAVTALLPREKTYNVAAVTDRNTSIGGGLVTQVIGVGATWTRGRKTHYLVQDQDTLALPVVTRKPATSSFAWYFRPVLGQEYVRSGMKQTFVQLAFPTRWTAKSYGQVRIRTYWRKFDAKTGLAGDIIDKTLRVNRLPAEGRIPTIGMGQYPQEFDFDAVEDLGSGQLLMSIVGRFLTGTQIRVGSNFLGDSSGANFSMQHRMLRFAASAYSLATEKVAIVTRDGTERELTFPLACAHGKDPAVWDLEATAPKIERLDELQSKLTFTFRGELPGKTIQPTYIIVVGRSAFGTSNAPLSWDGKTISVNVPNTVLIAARGGKIKRLFSKSGECELAFRLDGLGKEAQPERLVLLTQTKEAATFALYGSRLQDLTVLSPTTTPGELAGADKNSVRTLEFKANDFKTHKQIVLKRNNEGPFLIPMPALEFKEAAKPQAKAKERAVLNDDEMVLAGEGLDKVERIFWADKEAKFEKSADKGKTLKLVKLKSLGVTATLSTKDITLYLDSGKLTVPIEVVAKRVETKN
ncbi:MAG: hypothetical protein JST93_21625 [Acidobacteria bacterium]|nr:hypothetical protein [Acidobacteriota bacterium]